MFLKIRSSDLLFAGSVASPKVFDGLHGAPTLPTQLKTARSASTEVALTQKVAETLPPCMRRVPSSRSGSIHSVRSGDSKKDLVETGFKDGDASSQVESYQMSKIDANPTKKGEVVLVTEEHGGIPEAACTTIMLRNIPNKYSQRMLLEVFTNFGFDETFDFLYVPADFAHRLNLGYCFVNFKTPAYAQQFARVMQDYNLPAFKSKKKIQISLANTQGFQANILKLEHTALCSDYVSPEFHPFCVDQDTGIERPFLSYFPNYVPPPKSRVTDPEYWAKQDAKRERAWQGDSIFPPVYVKQPLIPYQHDELNKNKGRAAQPPPPPRQPKPSSTAPPHLSTSSAHGLMQYASGGPPATFGAAPGYPYASAPSLHAFANASPPPSHLYRSRTVHDAEYDASNLYRAARPDDNLHFAPRGSFSDRSSFTNSAAQHHHFCATSAARAAEALARDPRYELTRADPFSGSFENLNLERAAEHSHQHPFDNLRGSGELGQNPLPPPPRAGLARWGW